MSEKSKANRNKPCILTADSSQSNRLGIKDVFGPQKTQMLQIFCVPSAESATFAD
jgi:hypothetical protein